jgi:hypothetical protein
MKVFWKLNPTQVGIITQIYVTDNGQKRLTVTFPYSIIDADISNFELAA